MQSLRVIQLQFLGWNPERNPGSRETPALHVVLPLHQVQAQSRLSISLPRDLRPRVWLLGFYCDFFTHPKSNAFSERHSFQMHLALCQIQFVLRFPVSNAGNWGSERSTGCLSYVCFQHSGLLAAHHLSAVWEPPTMLTGQKDGHKSELFSSILSHFIQNTPFLQNLVSKPGKPVNPLHVNTKTFHTHN